MDAAPDAHSVAVQEVLANIGQALEGLARRLDALEAAALSVAPTIAGLSERIDAVEAAPIATHSLGSLAARVESLEHAAAVEAVSRWVTRAVPPAEQCVSVVTPTRNRPEELRRAIASVRAQTHERWEMVVVDDGGDVDVSHVVEEAADPRVRHFRTEGGGVCAARNHALSHASGSIIAYLDDDNIMDPGWLAALAWVFTERPDVDVAYGGLLIDDMRRAHGAGSGSLPQLYLRGWDRQDLLTHNLTDISAIAHRAGLPHAHFDERLEPLGDWDLLIRLTTRKPPLMVPVIACYYSTAGADRLSHRLDDLATRRESILAAHAIERRLGREEA